MNPLRFARRVVRLSLPQLCVWSFSILSLSIPSFNAAELNAQGPAEYVVLVSIDGLRGEEVFGGADRRLFLPDLGIEDEAAAREEYDADDDESRRAKLMPFLWNRISQGGWIAGDVRRDSLVRVTNGRYFSYPGYQELLCGFADDQIDSNAKKYNPNTTVLEWLNGQPELTGRVSAYCSWDVFPFIINDRRSQVPVNAGWQDLKIGRPDVVAALNNAANHLFHQWSGVRYDVFTASGALEEVAKNQPRVLYVALGETDDWAHAGRYDRYLLAARQNDSLIQQLWAATQQHPDYRRKTAFVLTSDHGRGDGREGWKNHSAQLAGSERIWVAAFGAGVSKSGIDEGGQFTQSQVAATVASLLGYDFCASDERIAKPLPIVSPNQED